MGMDAGALLTALEKADEGMVTLTAKVDLTLTSLQMEFVLYPDTQVLHVPRSSAQAADGPVAPPVDPDVPPST